MKITQLSVEEKQTLKEIFSRSQPVLNFINDQSRQEKVIGCIAIFCKCCFSGTGATVNADDHAIFGIPLTPFLYFFV